MFQRRIFGLAIYALLALLAVPAHFALGLPLSGDYDIGSGGDFTTIGAAITALVADGVSGPVTLRLANGLYVEQVVIPPIAGASAASSITFRSASGVREDVLWQFGLDSQESVILIDGADHLRFYHLSFDAAPLPRLSVHILKLQNGADDIQVIDCALRGSSAFLTGALVTATVLNSFSHVRIEDSLFEQFRRAIQLTGGGVQTGVTIRGNRILDDRASPALEVGSCDSVLIEANEIVADGPAILTQGCTNLLLRDNVVTADVTGIRVNGGGGGSEPIGMVANNMVSVGSSQTGGGLMLGGNLSGLRVFHNTVVATEATLTGGAAFLIDQVSSLQGQLRIRNNLFLHTGAGLAVRARGNVPNLDFDANDLHSMGVNLANWYNVLYADLAALQAGGGFNADSVSKPVQFEYPGVDLHLSSCSVGDVELRGLALPEVPVDIDGDTRPTNVAYMGADEAAHSPRHLFAPRQTQALTDAWHFDMGDLDGDGDLDLAVASGPSDGPGSVAIGWNDGSGNLTFDTSLAVSSAWVWKVRVADLDADGSADILALTASGAQTTWLIWSEGEGSFAAPQVLSDLACCPFNELQVGDLDGDGDLDVSGSYAGNAVNGDQPGLFGYLNEGSRQFVADSGDFTSSTVEDPAWHELCDVDGDGLLDALLMDDATIDEDLAVHFNLGLDGDDVWRGFDPVGQRHGIGSLVRFRVGDVNGDAAADLLSFDDANVPGNPLALWAWPNDGAGNFPSESQIDTDPYRTPAQFVSFDYEGDDDLDVVTVSTTGELSLYTNDGAGDFSRLVGCDPAGAIAGSFVWYKDMEAGDFDGDGALDVAVLHSDAGTDSLSIYLNLGWTVVGVEPDSDADGLVSRAGLWLGQNVPNPFNPSTRIEYRVAAASGAGPSRVTLTLYNLRGERVRSLVEGRLAPGSYEARWDGRDDAGRAVASGVYLYVLSQDGTASDTRKMVLVR